jgi:hypothetical protein
LCAYIEVIDKPCGKFYVMPGLVPGIHVFLRSSKDVDVRDKPGHDVEVVDS